MNLKLYCCCHNGTPQTHARSPDLSRAKQNIRLDVALHQVSPRYNVTEKILTHLKARKYDRSFLFGW